ncbi:hypothetical protein CROQUDRAFT_101817 [Cronartium quercuum f. sp. fusiforme G11]|uniref:Uncharacterized protein n=1 Tax=Cronartium quercuum f. sp. fusiforme G11 TaxID=708437 RepID=A0A9P6N7N6_9BASI|nr:hypothetical protein CROQUDRAFT_101817 [Cronartium quercuum f. sp. fusiforme G11]
MTTNTTNISSQDLSDACIPIKPETTTASGRICKLKDYSLLKFIGAGSVGETYTGILDEFVPDICVRDM